MASKDRLQTSVHRTPRLHHRCCAKSCSPVYSKFSEARLSCGCCRKSFSCREHAVVAICSVTYVDECQLPVYSKFINTERIACPNLTLLFLWPLTIQMPSARPIRWTALETCEPQTDFWIYSIHISHNSCYCLTQSKETISMKHVDICLPFSCTEQWTTLSSFVPLNHCSLFLTNVVYFFFVCCLNCCSPLTVWLQSSVVGALSSDYKHVFFAERDSHGVR